jgi:hypothetical protein
MHKASIFAASTVFAVTLSTQAFAQEPASTAAPAPAPAPDALPTPASPSPSGVTFDMGLGGKVLGGQIVQGVDFTSVQSTVAVKLGVYVTQHVGLSVAAEGGYGKMSDGFDNAYSIRVPVRVEYAANDRFHGVYLDGGLSFVNKLGASTGGTASSDASPVTLEASAPLETSFGVGYRIPYAVASLDLRLGLDVGTYTEIAAHSADVSAEGPVDPAKQAMHYAINLGFAYRFGSR